MAAGLGFEPRHAAPKAAVLPLDDPATLKKNFVIILANYINIL